MQKRENNYIVFSRNCIGRNQQWAQ